MPTPLNRIIIFVADVQKCANFYRKMFHFKALPSIYLPADWQELDTGGCRLAFHKAHGAKGPIKKPTGSASNPHKIVFFAKNVKAERTKLVNRGAKMGKIYGDATLALCDGQDPEGHRFQISNRA